AQVLNGNNSFHFASPVSLSFCITRFRFRAFVRCFSCGTAMACPFGDALAYELAQVFDVVTSFTPEISAVSLGLPAASKPAWVEGKAVSSAKSASRAEFVFVVG